MRRDGAERKRPVSAVLRLGNRPLARARSDATRIGSARVQAPLL